MDNPDFQGIGGKEYVPQNDQSQQPFLYQQQGPSAPIKQENVGPPPMMMQPGIVGQQPQAAMVNPGRQALARPPVQYGSTAVQNIHVRVQTCANHPQIQAMKACVSCGLPICHGCHGGYGPLSRDMNVTVYAIFVAIIVGIFVVLGFLFIILCVLLIFFGVFFIFIPRFGLLYLLLGDRGGRAPYCHQCYASYQKRRKTKGCIVLSAMGIVFGTACCCTLGCVLVVVILVASGAVGGGGGSS